MDGFRDEDPGNGEPDDGDNDAANSERALGDQTHTSPQVPMDMNAGIVQPPPISAAGDQSTGGRRRPLAGSMRTGAFVAS